MLRTTREKTDRLLAADLFRYGRLTGKRGFLKGLIIPGFRYTYLFRKASEAREHSIKWWVFSYLKRKASFKFGFQIPSYTAIAEGLYLEHFGPVVIHNKTVIGENCHIAPNVIIEQSTKGSPTIGNRVYIGAGSVLLGKISIGSDVCIAPNSFVEVSVPKHSYVSGNPCVIVSKENPCEDYMHAILAQEK